MDQAVKKTFGELEATYTMAGLKKRGGWRLEKIRRRSPAMENLCKVS